MDKAEFEIGEIVYLKTDPDQHKRIVIGLWIRQTGIEYELACGDESSYHFDFEISKDKNIM